MKRKQNGISIIHTVNDRSNGIYVETDILERTITLGRGLQRRCLTLHEATRLERLLKKQIKRINDRWQDSQPVEFTICPNCGKEEVCTANFCGNCGCKLSSATKEMALLEQNN